MNNLELLTKELQELNELENNENNDLNGIEQMNEMYRMIQEDKEGNILQEKRREKGGKKTCVLFFSVVI